MPEIWPYDEKIRLERAAVDPVRPFRCLLLMPFEGRFNAIATLLEETVSGVIAGMGAVIGPDLPHIVRIDWVTSSGAIQQDIWQEIGQADLVFCDITGHNPNVMFEAGVCAAWKDVSKVIFIKDRFFRQLSAFDIAPIRYTEYALTSDAIPEFKKKVEQLVRDVIIAFPDLQGTAQPISLPIEINFQDGRDDERICTPPFAHRRVVDGRLEFGSRTYFSHSWASIGKRNYLNFELEFRARFVNRLAGAGFIGVGFRSQHYFANFTHMVYLNHEGKVILVQPNEMPPNFYQDDLLHTFASIDFDAEHNFYVSLDEQALVVQVDGFRYRREVGRMPKVLGPGLIRFQSHASWMAVARLRLSEAANTS